MNTYVRNATDGSGALDIRLKHVPNTTPGLGILKQALAKKLSGREQKPPTSVPTIN